MARSQALCCLQPQPTAASAAQATGKQTPNAHKSHRLPTAILQLRNVRCAQAAGNADTKHCCNRLKSARQAPMDNALSAVCISAHKAWKTLQHGCCTCLFLPASQLLPRASPAAGPDSPGQAPTGCLRMTQGKWQVDEVQAKPDWCLQGRQSVARALMSCYGWGCAGVAQQRPAAPGPPVSGPACVADEV